MMTVSFLWLPLPVHSGSLKRIEYSKLYSLTHTLLLNVFSALKGTHFYILLAKQSSDSSAEEMRESGMAFQSLIVC